MVPILSSRNVPMMFKIGLSVFISFLIFASMGLDKPIPMDGEYVLLIIREMLIGVLLGFLAYIFLRSFKRLAPLWICKLALVWQV